jgi:hypothetical protein
MTLRTTRSLSSATSIMSHAARYLPASMLIWNKSAYNDSSSSTKKLRNCSLACVLLFGAAATVSEEARAATIGDPPSGNVIFDLVASGTTTLTSYTQFTTSFVAAVPITTISFAFREYPAYFAFDDASITGTGVTGFVDPGFESATIGQNVPAGWNRWITPEDTSAIGVVVGALGGNCTPNTPHAGSQEWCDGSVQGYDALYQSLATTVGSTYNISFWLGDNSSGQTAPTINMLVYATDGLPGDVIQVGVTPEPASFVLIGVGLVGLAFARRRRAA